MTRTKRLWTLAFSASLLIAGCSKNDTPAPNNTAAKPLNNGLYVLNEGNSNNATELTYYDSITNTATTDIYKNVNGTQLGEYGNDILIYGSKLYIVMNGSNNVTAIDKRTTKLTKQIFATDGASWQPRYAIPYNGKILVSAWDGTLSVIDTASLNITNTITIGSNLEQMGISGNMLYVAISGGLNYPNYDSTVSVIDLTTMTQTKKIKVGLNPNKIAINSEGNIFVLTYGNYGTVSPKIYEINGSTQTLVDSSSALANADKMIIYKDVIYLDGTGSQSVLTLNSNNIEGNLSNFITDGTTLTNPYGISIDAANNYVYVTDAIDFKSPGKVYCFDNTGKLKYPPFTTDIAPDNVVFLK